MPTAIPAPAAPRRRPYGLLRTFGMLVILMVGRWLFTAAMWCADVADGFVRRD